MLPPKRSIPCRAMAMPRPAPSGDLRRAGSTRKKGLKCAFQQGFGDAGAVIEDADFGPTAVDAKADLGALAMGGRVDN